MRSLLKNLQSAAANTLRLGAQRVSGNAPPQPRRILLTRVQYLGDCVVFIPTITAIRRSFPDACIHVLAGTGPGEAVFRMCPAVDEIVRTEWDKPRTPEQKQAEVEELRALRCDTALLSTEETGAALKMFLAGIPWRAGFGRVEHMGEVHTERMPWLLNRVLEQPQGMHETEVNLQLAEAIGADISLADWDLRPGQAAEDEATQLLSASGLTPDGYICIHSAAKRDVKLWEPEQFAAAADLIARQGFAVAFLGAPGDHEPNQRIISLMNTPAANLAGRTTIPVLAAALKRSAGFLGNDSGPMHLAAALGVPVTAIFVASDPAQWGPRAPEGRRAVFTVDQAAPERVAASVISLAGAGLR